LFGEEIIFGSMDKIMLNVTFVRKCSNNSLCGLWIKLWRICTCI